MKAVFEICHQGNSVEQKISQMRLDHIKGDILTKPIPKQTLEFFRGIKINRFVVPSETSLPEALQIYYREYQILYQQNKKLNRQFIQVIEEKNQLVQILISKKKLNESLGGKVKRKRRYASQIKRKFHCPIDECGKCYGTEGSLTQHVKIKHLEYFKSGDYEIYLTDIIKDKLCLDTNSI